MTTRYMRGFYKFLVSYRYNGLIARFPIWARTSADALAAARRRGLDVTGEVTLC